MIQNLDPEVFCSLFIGHSIFTISCRQSVLKIIEDYLKGERFETEMDDFGEIREHNVKRRMFQTLMVPIPRLQEKKIDVEGQEDSETDLGLFSCLEMIPYIIDSGASETLMNISLLCQNTSTVCYVDSILDLR